MNIREIVLEYVPFVVAGAATVGAICSGAIDGLAGIVMSNAENARPAVDALGVTAVFFSSYYVARKPCDYFAADSNDDPDR